MVLHVTQDGHNHEGASSSGINTFGALTQRNLSSMGANLKMSPPGKLLAQPASGKVSGPLNINPLFARMNSNLGSASPAAAQAASALPEKSPVKSEASGSRDLAEVIRLQGGAGDDDGASNPDRSPRDNESQDADGDDAMTQGGRAARSQVPKDPAGATRYWMAMMGVKANFRDWQAGKAIYQASELVRKWNGKQENVTHANTLREQLELLAVVNNVLVNASIMP